MLGELQRGRDAWRRRAWEDCRRALSAADGEAPLEPDDLELLASASYLVGRELEFCRTLARAHHAHLDGGGRVRAARCAFGIGLHLLLRGEAAQSDGWLARAQRLVEGVECVVHGYLLLPEAERRLARGEAAAAHAAAADAAAAGERFHEADLVACARHLQGRALVQLGRIDEGLALLDEAMLPVVTGELSPIMTGLVYCSVIATCGEIHAFRHAREWTAALARWCEQQPQLIAFTSTCLVHRAELLQLDGEWRAAMAEAARACERLAPGGERGPPPAALYRRAELHRLLGELAAAEEAYRAVSRLGGDPQPGLALLRLAQGRAEAAAAGIRRVVSATPDPLRRATLLPAHVEIMLATGDLEEARRGCRALEEVAARYGTDALRALAAQARGAVALAEGDPRAALGPLREAFEAWGRVAAPYDGARVRVLVGLACRELEDEDAGELELSGARAIFERLGAAPDVARVDALGGRRAPRPSPLTGRELQVLRLVAAGKTNRAIAAELSLSARTIDRHVSNIFRKLSVPSRAAATAYAYGHKLL